MGLNDELTDRILQGLANSRRFIPVEREALRKVVEEQRFGQARSDDFVTRALDEAIGDMDDIDGVTIQAIGALAKFKDADNDIKDLGTAMGADILVFAKLEKLENRKATTKAVPYSRDGRTSTTEVSDGRLIFRVVRISTGEVIGVGSIRSHLSESIYAGSQSRTDDFTFLDQLAQEATARIIDVTFPATIVSLDPLVVSRGENDGVRSGDRYVVKREGKEVMDGSVSLGRLLSDIGTLELTDINKTMSIARSTGGSSFSVGDLVLISASSGKDRATSLGAAGQAGKSLMGTPRKPNTLPRVAMGSIKFGATGDASATAVSQFTDRIISGLAATKRFQMIDRQEVDQLLAEQEAQAIAGNRGMASGMGSLAGADYLVYGNVALFELQAEPIVIPGASRDIEQKVGRVDGTIRIVDARSGDIVDSRNIEVRKPIPSGASEERSVTILANAYSDKLVTILLNAIYPIKVAAITANGTVYINRGLDGGIVRGDSLQAFRPGQAIIDPDTGIELGVEESPVGSVEIVMVEDARSQGVAAPGSGLEVGDILRVAQGGSKSRRRSARPSGSDRGAAGRPTLAIGKIRLGDASRVQQSQSSYIGDLAGILARRLSQTNRFEILERKEIDQMVDEKMFQAATSGEDMSELLSGLAGADYMVYAELTDFRIVVKSQEIALLDEVQVRTSGIAKLSLRVVDVVAGSVLAAEQVSINQRLTGGGEPGSTLVDLLSVSAVKLILERIYPIRVIGLLSDKTTVYLNRGEDGDLKTGMIFDLTRAGSEMFDQDTGQSFGSVEEKVGKLKVVSVEASRSRAEVVSGGTPAVGDIARIASESKAKTVVKKEKRAVNRPSF